MSLPLDKITLRTTLLQRRKMLNSAEVETRSAAAQSLVLGLSAYRRASAVALYSPIQNEVETSHLLSDALRAGKQVCYPRVFAHELRFFLVKSSADLQPGHFGVLEPSLHSPEISPASIDVLLVPGVAFDCSGARLGYGRGYFDRLFAAGRFAGVSVGFCYDFQILETLPVEAHDKKVALLVTDKEIYSPLRI